MSKLLIWMLAGCGIVIALDVGWWLYAPHSFAECILHYAAALANAHEVVGELCEARFPSDKTLDGLAAKSHVIAFWIVFAAAFFAALAAIKWYLSKRNVSGLASNIQAKMQQKHAELPAPEVAVVTTAADPTTVRIEASILDPMNRLIEDRSAHESRLREEPENFLSTAFTKLFSIFSFRGRANRSFYVCWCLLAMTVVIAPALAPFTAEARSIRGWITIFVVYLSLVVQVRRLHDLSLRGWFVIFGLIPYVGAFGLLFYSCFNPGNAESNRFGEPPSKSSGHVIPLLVTLACVVLLTAVVNFVWKAPTIKIKPVASTVPLVSAKPLGDASKIISAPATLQTLEAKTASEIYLANAESVVVIESFDAKGKLEKLGSGVVLPGGTVATNCHVLENGSAFEVVDSDKTHGALLRYRNNKRDVCGLAVPGLSRRAITFGTVRDLKIGESVYAIGSPEGLNLTLSAGIVSGLRAYNNGQYIQTTAAISPGSSGGGLFDQSGKLVGLTTFFVGKGQNLNFALPVEWVKEILVDVNADRPVRTMQATPSPPHGFVVEATGQVGRN
jgi:S1-C subfamily serine protease